MKTIKSLLLVAAFHCFLLPIGMVSADDVAFRKAMAGAIRAAANRALPSVVTVEIIGAAGVGEGEVEQDAPTSGVVVDDAGYVIASSIVVRRPSASILVVLPDGSRHAAKVVARDHHRDLVLLQIKTDKPLTAIDFPDPLALQIGQTTICAGRYGVDAAPLVSSGVLSATERLDGIALQTDARVAPSFYGGPLLDLRGNFLGILIPAVAEGGAPDDTSWYDSGIAFAIPSAVLKRKLDRLRDGQDIKKGLIGIVSKSKDPYANDTEIAAVRTRSPAEAAGVKAGDRVVSVAGKAVRRHQEIRQVLGSFDAGEQIRITVERDGQQRDFEITLAEEIPPLDPQRLGLVGREQQVEGDDEEATTVVVDKVLPEGAVAETLQEGDVIVSLGEKQIADVESLRRLMITAEADKPVSITFTRDGEEQSSEVTPTSIAGPLFRGVPAAWISDDDTPWKTESLKLPDVGNEAAVVLPEDVESVNQLGLLVLLLNPGEGSPQEALKPWPELARKHGVVVCAVSPENNGRWQPKELDVIGRFAAAVIKKAPIEESAVAVAAAGALRGGKAEAADSMALAVAVSQSKTFFGAAISARTRPPAVRIRENNASASLQVLLPIDSRDDLPTWSANLERAGYPVVLGGQVDRATLLQWVRLLQSI